MALTRRTLLAGLAAAAAAPAWAQAIGPQSDPWAQVDPYADPRNGFTAERAGGGAPGRAGGDVFANSPQAAGGMSLEEEITLARRHYPQAVKDRGGAFPDPAVQKALADFCRPMFAVADRRDLPWEVTLVNNASPNAAAGLGGKVMVHAGLLRICDRAGELAATLAHEIGHVDKYHSARSAPLMSLLHSLRQGGDGMISAAQMEMLVPGGGVRDVWQLFDLGFSRADEVEADAHEMVILERLGVDPIHAINDQLNFAKLNGDGSGGSEMALTHPHDADRLAHIRQLAALQSRPAKDYVFPGWDVLKAAFPTHPDFKKA